MTHFSTESLQSPVSSLNTSPDVLEGANWESHCDRFLQLLSESVCKRDACCGFPLLIDKVNFKLNVLKCAVFFVSLEYD